MAELEVGDDRDIGVVLPDSVTDRRSLVGPELFSLVVVGSHRTISRLRTPDEHAVEPLQQAALADAGEYPPHRVVVRTLLGGLEREDSSVETLRARDGSVGGEQPLEYGETATPEPSSDRLVRPPSGTSQCQPSVGSYSGVVSR